MFYKNNKKGIVPVIIISSLLLVSITIYLSVQENVQFITSELKVDLESKDISQYLQVQKVEGTNLYLQNDYKNNLIINQIKIGNTICNSNNVSINLGLNTIDIGSCIFGNNELDVKEVVIFTNDGVVSEYEMLRSVVAPFSILFQSSTCNIADGYVRLYGLSNMTNAHAEDSNSSLYTYNICVKHIDYTLGTTETGIYQTLFYLNSFNNSAIFVNKSSIYEIPSEWFPVSLSSSGGNFSYIVGGARPDSNYSCIGKIDRDDVYGSHIGNCESTLNDTLWIKLR